MTRVSIHSIELTPLECEVLSELMAAKLEQHLADRAKYVRRTDSVASPRQAGDSTTDGVAPAVHGAFPFCEDCLSLVDDGGGSCATHRCACESCGRDDLPLHTGDLSKKIGEDGRQLWERWCSECDPVVVGEKHADAQVDPWDLPEAERNATADLSRETPAYWGRDRSDWDELDTRSDIQPFERTTK